jgi:mono/diheme cytochrome c family protein
MRIRDSIWFLAVLAISGAVCFAQQAKQEEAKPAVKRAPAEMTSPSSGKEMFMSYCASCHGKTGKGDGPAASSLKQRPADLTMLAKNNGGKYPSDKVTAVLRGQANLTAHGDQEMPVWGPVFWKMSQGHEEQVHMRIANLNKYLESIQAK